MFVFLFHFNDFLNTHIIKKKERKKEKDALCKFGCENAMHASYIETFLRSDYCNCFDLLPQQSVLNRSQETTHGL